MLIRTNTVSANKRQPHAAQLRSVYAQCLISCASAHQTSRNQILLMGLEFISALPNESVIQENHFLSRNTYKIRTKKIHLVSINYKIKICSSSIEGAARGRFLPSREIAAPHAFGAAISRLGKNFHEPPPLYYFRVNLRVTP